MGETQKRSEQLMNIWKELSLVSYRDSWQWDVTTHSPERSKLKCLRTAKGFPGGGSDGKESACSAGDLGSVPGLGRSPGGGNGNLLQYYCLENPTDRRAWQATVHPVRHEWATDIDRECGSKGTFKHCCACASQWNYFRIQFIGN